MSLPKTEDAFEVWLVNRHQGAKVDAQAEFSMRAAFLAGAEYGAAVGEEACPFKPTSPAEASDDYPEPMTDRYSTLDGVTAHVDRPWQARTTEKLDTSKLKAKIWDNTPQSNPDMTHSTAGFTPLVPVPKDFWVTMRCRDLAQAIKEWLEYDSGKVKQRDANEPESPDIVADWIRELEELWKTL